MAGKTIVMSKIKQVLRLYQQGISNRQIGISLGIYKGTVNNYIKKLKAGQYNIVDLMRLDDPVLEGLFHPGSPAYLQERFTEFKPLIPYLEKELGRKHVTRKLLWEEYRTEYPDGYGYSQFCYHLSQLLVARKSSAIIDHDPGNKLEIDFAGDTLGYVNRDTGELIKVQVFVAACSFSKYAYAIAVPSQRTDDFLYALGSCLEHLGGVPHIVIPDNLKAAVIKADRYEPELNTLMSDFANYYGFTVIPARPYKPRDKPNTEQSVKLVYQRVYAKLRNHTFFSLEELNKAIIDKVREHNQTRMQRFDHSREELFLAQEQSLLRPLPESPYQIKYYASLIVLANNCIYLARDKHHYSVPFQYIGTRVQIIYTRTLVKIYTNNECVATHQRSISPGYTSLVEHFGSTHQHQMRRSPDYYIGLATKKSHHLEQLIMRIFQVEKIPELAFKSCDALLSLQRKTDPKLFDKACDIACQNDLLSYKRLERIIQQCAQEEEINASTVVIPMHGNIRGKEYYN